MRISGESVTIFLNNRTEREKKMLALLAAGFLLVVDYWGVIFPVMRDASHVGSQLSALKQEAAALKEDRKNKAVIEKDWGSATERVAMLEKKFLAQDETPALLENLSKQAQSAGLKILSLKPAEESPVKGGGTMERIPIVIEALAGTHELGFFLERLESGTTFFRVNDLKITAAEGGAKRHLVKLSIEALRQK